MCCETEIGPPLLISKHQNTRIGPKEHSASIKRSRSHTINENKAKKKLLIAWGRGPKIATQAMESFTIWYPRTRMVDPHSRFGQIRVADPRNEWRKKSTDLLAAKLMVKMRNLFRQKDSPRPCLEDAEVKRQLLVDNKLGY
jgi:hypothetical protein